MRIISIVGLLAIASLGMTGCNKNLKNERNMLHNANVELREQNDRLSEALDTCNEDSRRLAREKADLQRRMDSAATTVATGFENIPGVSSSTSPGEVTASVESDVLFDSGKSSIKGQAKDSLNAVASVLNSTYGGQSIRIEGHTDTDPIRKSGFKSNHHLGFERAYAVRDYLISRGVDASRLWLASFGPDEPKSSKPSSRRVEVVVMVGN